MLEKLPDTEFLEKGLPEICRGGMDDFGKNNLSYFILKGKMCGDVNLYLHEYLEPEEAEIEVIILLDK